MNSLLLVKERRCFALVAVLLWSTILSCLGANTDRRVLAGHRPSIVAKLSNVGKVPATNQISLAIGLPLRSENELDQLVQQLYDPSSTNFHRFLSPAEFTARFGPTEDDYRAVIKFAENNGLSVMSMYSNRMVLDVKGNASNVEQAFQIKLNQYNHPTKPRLFFAPDTDPSVPANVPVNDMWGLSDYSQPTPLAHKVASAKEPVRAGRTKGMISGTRTRPAPFSPVPAKSRRWRNLTAITRTTLTLTRPIAVIRTCH
jgi:subtilase family serine protease